MKVKIVFKLITDFKKEKFFDKMDSLPVYLNLLTKFI